MPSPRIRPPDIRLTCSLHPIILGPSVPAARPAEKGSRCESGAAPQRCGKRPRSTHWAQAPGKRPPVGTEREGSQEAARRQSLSFAFLSLAPTSRARRPADDRAPHTARYRPRSPRGRTAGVAPPFPGVGRSARLAALRSFPVRLRARGGAAVRSPPGGRSCARAPVRAALEGRAAPVRHAPEPT